MAGYDQERRHRRRAIVYAAKVVLFYHADLEGQILNISEGGLGLESNAALPIGQPIGLNFLLSNPATNQSVAIVAIGKVIWKIVRGRLEGIKKDYRFGLKFEYVPPEQMAIIREFVAKMPA